MKAGDRIKTARRDAVMLAKLHRAGELTPVWVPDAALEVRASCICWRKQLKLLAHSAGFEPATSASGGQRSIH
jgi:transposase